MKTQKVRPEHLTASADWQSGLLFII